MSLLKGVFLGKKSDGTKYYRASFTYKNKHISLGSFSEEEDAHKAYLDAVHIVNSKHLKIEDFDISIYTLTFSKYISILNFRDNGIYIKTPIYIYKKFFEYYLDTTTVLKFDADDLFFYSTHKIMKRNNHLFVSDFGMQISILSRYGIKYYAVPGKDYIFINGDSADFRYNNIKIVNKYSGVTKKIVKGREIFIAKIHIRGNYIIGKYFSEFDAAIAYNKAVDTLKTKGLIKNFTNNYIEDITSIEYASRYNAVRISKKIREYRINKDSEE